MELLVEPAMWDLIRQTATDPDADTEPIQENEQKTSSANIAIARKRFEGT